MTAAYSRTPDSATWLVIVGVSLCHMLNDVMQPLLGLLTIFLPRRCEMMRYA